MQKKIAVILYLFALCSCATFTKGQGQVVYHWARESTGVEQFARDHSECLRQAEDFNFLPDFRSWFYSEEAKLDVRADWYSEKGIWASYVPYAGAQPLMLNSLRDDNDISPREYRQCMEDRGYWKRNFDIPEVTNIFVYKPQHVLQGKPFQKYQDF